MNAPNERNEMRESPPTGIPMDGYICHGLTEDDRTILRNLTESVNRLAAAMEAKA